MKTIFELALEKKQTTAEKAPSFASASSSGLSMFESALMKTGNVAVIPDGRVSVSQVISLRGAPVAHSADFDRIKALPRRSVELQDGALAAKWTRLLVRENIKCLCKKKYGYCITTLNNVQGVALEEIVTNGGLFAPIGVGHGKTGIDILAAVALKSTSAVLLLPASLKKQFMRDWQQWSFHFKTPNIAGDKFFESGMPTLHVMSYNELSSAKNTEFLEKLQPDLIVADEAHNLKNLRSARGRRVQRLFKQLKTTKFVALSGTMTTKSLKDYAHISGWALKERSPTPDSYNAVVQWASAIDASDFQAPAGVLKEFCAPGETARVGYRNRLIETKGVVATAESSIGATLIMGHRKGVQVPKEITAYIADIEKTWQRPDGEEIVEAVQKAAIVRQMACGFYYKWIWPRNESKATIEHWLEIRALWNSELRERLKRPKPGMDSPLLCINAAERFLKEEKGTEAPVWDSKHWPEWKKVKDSAQPETVPVWVSEYLVEDSVAWAQENTGIVWYEHSCFGQKLAQKIKLYGAGDDGADLEDGKRTIACSIKAQGTGKKLHMFYKNLLANPLSDGAAWEQLLGRTHRIGQLSDEVYVTNYLHAQPFVSAMNTALSRSRYIQESLGSKQKLLSAAWEFDIEDFKV